MRNRMHADRLCYGAFVWISVAMTFVPCYAFATQGRIIKLVSSEDAFRNPVLAEAAAMLFDGVGIKLSGTVREGIQVRDVAAGSHFTAPEDGKALELSIVSEKKRVEGTTFIDITVKDLAGRGRAVTLVYAVPIPREGLTWLDQRRRITCQPGKEYGSNIAAGRVGTGRRTRYPFGAVAQEDKGKAIGIDLAYPAFYRIGYNADTEELFFACDFALPPEKDTARFRLVTFDFKADWGFRSALAEYYSLFPEYFKNRCSEQGLWMPFRKISEVEGFEDFGFAFKEGDNETAWDDRHGILTFGYITIGKWWMRMNTPKPWTYAKAESELAQLQASGEPAEWLSALTTSAVYDESGKKFMTYTEEPWCKGVGWSMNSMPGIEGTHADYKLRAKQARRFLASKQRGKGDMDGIYIDSLGGFMTTPMNFRREHFVAARTPLVFARDDFRPIIHFDFMAYEFTRAIKELADSQGKLTMANGPLKRHCLYLPWLDVMGTETNWNRGARWQPMSDEEMIYRRAMCYRKPYCFLMNTKWQDFTKAHMEKYLKRCLAYGMFPGCFSPTASSQGHYFMNPSLANRDRNLFRQYMPLIKMVAAAGWEPITLARSSHPNVFVERYGDAYLTVFNDSGEQAEVTIDLDRDVPSESRNVISGREVTWQRSGQYSKATITLDSEDVALISLVR